MSKWSWIPKSVHDGHDPQLERAVVVALQQMKETRCRSRTGRRIPIINVRQPVAAPLLAAGGRSGLEIAAGSYPRNLYPNPWTVMRYSGSAGNRSIFWRNLEM